MDFSPNCGGNKSTMGPSFWILWTFLGGNQGFVQFFWGESLSPVVEGSGAKLLSPPKKGGEHVRHVDLPKDI